MPTEINDRSSGNESIKRTETGNKSMDVDEKGYILRAERKMVNLPDDIYSVYLQFDQIIWVIMLSCSAKPPVVYLLVTDISMTLCPYDKDIRRNCSVPY
jgi:hypothetical protein